ARLTLVLHPFPTRRSSDLSGEVETTGATGAEQPTGLVVLLAFLRVRQHAVGFRHGLELLLGLGVARIGVRMVLPGELAIRLLDLLGGGVGGDAQFAVIVLSDPFPRVHRASPPLLDSSVLVLIGVDRRVLGRSGRLPGSTCIAFLGSGVRGGRTGLSGFGVL